MRQSRLISLSSCCVAKALVCLLAENLILRNIAGDNLWVEYVEQRKLTKICLRKQCRHQNKTQRKWGKIRFILLELRHYCNIRHDFMDIVVELVDLIMYATWRCGAWCKFQCSVHGRGGINFIVCDTFSVSNGLYFIYTQFFRHFFSTLSFIPGKTFHGGAVSQTWSLFSR